MQQKTDALNVCFVYGSLRPDDDSGQSWTRSALEGLNCQRAEVHGATLYKDMYASAVLKRGKAEEARKKQEEEQIDGMRCWNDRNRRSRSRRRRRRRRRLLPECSVIGRIRRFD